MKNNSIVIEPGLVDFADLETLASHIATVKGSVCTVQQQFIVTSADPAVLTAIGALFEPVPEKAAKREKKIRSRSKIVKESWQKEGDTPKPAQTRGLHVRSIEVVGSAEGKKISRYDLDKALQERTAEVGAKYRSPKHGMMTVAFRGGDLVLVNDQNEVV